MKPGTKMKPHVTLVNPAAPPAAVMHLPFALLGLGYLGAVLEKNRFQVDVIDFFIPLQSTKKRKGCFGWLFMFMVVSC